MIVCPMCASDEDLFLVKMHDDGTRVIGCPRCSHEWQRGEAKVETRRPPAPHPHKDPARQQSFADTSTVPAVISTGQLDTAKILQDAIQSHTEMEKLPGWSYERTSQLMHEVGKHGEHAVFAYLANQIKGVTWPRQGEYEHGDIWLYRTRTDGSQIEPLRVEVKTSRERDWIKYGRTFDAAQLRRVQSSVIVWCVVANSLPTPYVKIMGWLPTDEARGSAIDLQIEPPAREKVRVSKAMCAPNDILSWLVAQPQGHVIEDPWSHDTR